MSSGVLAAWGTSPAGAEDWRDQASCSAYDAELWFPIGTGGPAVRQTEMAVAVCGSCEVRGACLQYALGNFIADGIWGGLTEDERSSLRRRTNRRRAATGQPAPENPRDSVPCENTLALIAQLREAGRTWEQVARKIGVSESTARQIHSGTKARIWRSIEDRATAARERVSAG